jgi:hypothetical protein
MTNKQMTSDPTGAGGLTLTSANFLNNAVNTHRFLYIDIGLPDEFWRSFSEFTKTCFFIDKETAYMFFDNKITDIGRLGYRKRLYYDGILSIKSGYDSNVCAVFDTNKQEYILDLSQKPIISGDLPQDNYHWVLSESLLTGNILVEPSDYITITNVNPLELILELPDFLTGETITLYNDTNYSIQVFDYNGILIGTLGNGILSTLTKLNGSPSWVMAFYNHNTGYLSNYEAYVCNVLDNPSWNGTYTYNFEKIICFDNVMYGIRNGKIYTLNTGFTLNGSTVTAKMISVDNSAQPLDKEFVAMVVDSNNKPTRIDFATDLSLLPECSLYAGMSTPPNAYFLKQYGKGRWTNKIPRKLAGIRDRMQSRKLIYSIEHDAAESFVLYDAVVNSKQLKLQI